MQRVRTWRSACSAARRKASRSPVVRYLRAPWLCAAPCRLAASSAALHVPLASGEAAWSRAPVLIAAPALPPGEAGECVEGSPRICVWIEAAAPFSANAAPLAEQQGASEQIGPNLHAVEAPFVALRPDADQRSGFREQRQLDRQGARSSAFLTLGHEITGTVSQTAAVWQGKPRPRRFSVLRVIHYR
jgi:hypothetical protein